MAIADRIPTPAPPGSGLSIDASDTVAVEALVTLYSPTATDRERSRAALILYATTRGKSELREWALQDRP